MTGGVAQTAPTDPSDRCGSFGWAMETVLAAVGRRRRLSLPHAISREVVATLEVNDADGDGDGDVEESTLATPTAAQDIATAITTRPGWIPAPSPFAADSDITGDEHDEPLLPMLPGRIGLSSDKARAFFERHGLSYDPRRRSSLEEPASKIRRVEKPIRVRLHFRCHKCEGSFNQTKNCAKCHHRRCVECTRQPARAVQDMMERGEQVREEEEEQRPRPPQTIAEWAADVSDSTTMATMDGAARGPSVERETCCVDDEVDAVQPYALIIDGHPRSGDPPQPSAQAGTAIRRCHKCKTPFPSPRWSECDKCHHSRCNHCLPAVDRPCAAPLTSADSSPTPNPPITEPAASVPAQVTPSLPPSLPSTFRTKPTHDLVASDDEAVSLTPPTVIRIYRKPRQHVRYTCEQCRTVFGARPTCRGCGHDKCEACLRSPRKRTHLHDPAVQRSVEERLMARGRERGRAPGTTPDLSLGPVAGPLSGPGLGAGLQAPRTMVVVDAAAG